MMRRIDCDYKIALSKLLENEYLIQKNDVWAFYQALF